MKTIVIPDSLGSGIKIDITEMNLGVFIYESLIEPGRFVIEIETSMDGKETLDSIKHDYLGRPQIKVMINDSVVSNDGGEEATS